MITESDLLALQGHAIATNDLKLRALTYAALGRSSQYAMEPVSDLERQAAIRSCTAQLETMRLAGEELRVPGLLSKAKSMVDALDDFWGSK